MAYLMSKAILTFSRLLHHRCEKIVRQPQHVAMCRVERSYTPTPRFIMPFAFRDVVFTLVTLVLICAVGCSTPKRLKSPTVHWSATQRAAFESQIRHGSLAVVQVDDEAVQLLRHCNVIGIDYEYVGVELKDEILQIRSEAELRKRLPLGSLVNVEGALDSAGELVVVWRMVGRYESEAGLGKASILSGECEGATHVVTAASIGAFLFMEGSKNELSGEIKSFLTGSSGRLLEETRQLRSDGNFRRCDSGGPGSYSPPGRCGSLLELEFQQLTSAQREPLVLTESEEDSYTDLADDPSPFHIRQFAESSDDSDEENSSTPSTRIGGWNLTTSAGTYNVGLKLDVGLLSANHRNHFLLEGHAWQGVTMRDFDNDTIALFYAGALGYRHIFLADRNLS